MNTCPCCSQPMLRHTRHHQVYWFCRHCWEEMPLLEVKSYPLTVLPHPEAPISPVLSISLSYWR